MSEWPRPYGPYVLLKSLGTGGSGDVFLGRPRDDSRGIPSPIVIKRLHGQLMERGDYVKRFRHEAELAVAIDSPHVARVFDVGRVGETFYIALEYLPGWPLSRVISDIKEAGHRPSLHSVADIIAGALSGLEALHGARHAQTGEALGIVHRDVAPKNIMVGEDGLTRLIDLGLGKSNLQDWKTGTGVVMGSPGYMAPEQVTGTRVDARTDTYAMGIVLWELLTLERYIKRGPVPLMLRAQVAPKFRAPTDFRADVPASLTAVCARALAVRPSDRFESAAAFRDALLTAVPAEEDEPAPLSTLVGDLLWGELNRSKTEVTHLLDLGAPAGLQDVEPVEIVAMRSPSKMPPPPPPAQTAAHEPLGPPLVEMAPAAAVGTPTPMGYPGSMASGPLPMPSGGVPLKVVLGLMIATLALGIGVGAILLRRQPETVIPPLPATATTPPAATPSAAPSAAPVIIEAPKDPTAARRAPTRKRSPSRASRTAEAEPAPKAAPVTAIGLLKRVRAVRDALPPGSTDARAAGRLLNDLQAEASTANPAPARLSGLAEEVERLERKARRAGR